VYANASNDFSGDQASQLGVGGGYPPRESPAIRPGSLLPLPMVQQKTQAA